VRRGLAAAALIGAAVPSFFFVFTLYMQVGLGFSPLHAGLTTLPYAAGSALAALSSDRLVRRSGLIWLQVGAVALAVGHGLVALLVGRLGAAMTSWYLAPGLLVSGLGLGALAAQLMNATLLGVRPREIGTASGVYATSSQIGSALGVALIGVVYFRLLPPLGAVAGLPPGARKLAFAGALSKTLICQVAIFALCTLLLPGLRRAAAARASQRSPIDRPSPAE
jgi:hypothetical protein